MPAISLTDLIAAAIVGLAIFIMALVWLISRKSHPEPYEPVDAYSEIEGLMHRSSEEGKALLLGIGEGFSGQNTGMGDSVSLVVEQILLGRSVFNDQPTRSFSGDGALACISQLVVHGAYQDAMATELFRSDHALLSGTGSFAWMAGMMPELGRAENAGLILTGTLRPEHILMSDLADRQDLPVIAATGSPAAQAAFFAAGTMVTLGEDYYLPTIGKINPRTVENSAITLNWLRIVIAIALVLAAILKLTEVLP